MSNSPTLGDFVGGDSSCRSELSSGSPSATGLASYRKLENYLSVAPETCRQAVSQGDDATEQQRAENYPVSRWYLRPAARWLAVALAPTRVRPVQLTFCGLTAAIAAATVLIFLPQAMPLAAVLVLAYWFFDRADGLLARRQRSASALGAWLDANVDELVDVGLHVAVAAAAAEQTATAWPWSLLVAFLAGKYLLMYGLTTEEGSRPARVPRLACPTVSPALLDKPAVAPDLQSRDGQATSVLRRAYHLPGNADVRVHLLALALMTGWLTVELALVAVYYNARWMVRYALVARRLGGVQ